MLQLSRVLRILGVLFGAAWSFNAHASCFTAWEGAISATSESSAADACNAFYALSGITSHANVPAGAENGFTCYYYHPVGGNYVSFGKWSKADGVSCTSVPPDPDPNPSRCNGKAGQSNNFIASNISINMCHGGCSMAMDKVIPFTQTVGGPVIFHYTGSYTGETCEDSVSPIDATPPDPTDSDSTQNCGPSSTVTDAEGRQITNSSCTTNDTMKNNQACVAAGGSLGSVQGMQTCIQAGKGPTGSTKTTTVDTTTTKNPNGSTSTKTTTTTTTKNCAGSKPCTTSTTTTTTTTSTNANGTPGGSSSVCKGDNCGTGGKEGDGKGGSGGGGGGSSDDGDGEDEEEQEPIPGPGGSLTKGEQGNFAEGIAEWDERIRDISQELDQQLDQYSNLFSGVFDLNLGTGSGSLPCEQIPISFGRFGSTTLDMCLNNYADILAYLRYALMLGAAVLAAFIVMKD